MSQQELLAKVVSVLTGAGIEYMITGSLASSLQGEPRFSHDIDLVVALDRRHVQEMIDAFPPPTYYLSESAVLSAIEQSRMFNVVDIAGGGKVDFWLLTDEPFDQSRFRRRLQIDVDCVAVWVSAPEDTILAKLRWAKLAGGSEKQFTDALRVYELQFPALDLSYLETWAERLEVTDLWARLIAEARTDG
jgi:hypothetical protein